MRIDKAHTIALFVDIQERLVPAMEQSAALIERNVLLLQGLQALEVPALFLRQYPKGLGDIVPELRAAARPDMTPMDKLAFSAMQDEAIAAVFLSWRGQGIKNVIVTGVEAHVCVLQSCVDLVAAGFSPFLAVDCISARRACEKELALRRAEQEGVRLTTAESVLFELCVQAGTEPFKVISKLVR